MQYRVMDLNGDNEFETFPTQRAAMEWVDNLLYTVKKFSLLSTLNEIQGVSWCKCGDGKDQLATPFPNKFDMPLIIVNLALKEHGIKISKT